MGIVFNHRKTSKGEDMKDIIEYENKRYQVSTINFDNTGMYQTMIFPIVNGQIDGREVYCFNTFNINEAITRHNTILKAPSVFVSQDAIQKYLESKKEEFKVNDLQKFKDFFDEMNIKYIERNGGNHCLSIHYSHICQSYGNAIDLIFDKNDNFIQFEAWGE